MTILGPTRHPRLNEGIGVVYLALGIAIILSLVSYHPADLSWNTVGAAAKPLNLIGKAGAHASDLLLQLGGLGAFTLPVLLFALAWKWLRSETIEAQIIKIIGASALIFGACTAFSLGPQWRPFGGAISAGGLAGTLVADYLLSNFNTTGAILVTASTLVLSLYLVSSFSMTKLASWLAGPIAFFKRLGNKYESWRDIRRQKRAERTRLRAEQARLRTQENKVRRTRPSPALPQQEEQPLSAPTASRTVADPEPACVATDTPPWDEEIPIRTLEEDKGSAPARASFHEPEPVVVPPAPDPEPAAAAPRAPVREKRRLPIAARPRRCSTSHRVA